MLHRTSARAALLTACAACAAPTAQAAEPAEPTREDDTAGGTSPAPRPAVVSLRARRALPVGRVARVAGRLRGVPRGRVRVEWRGSRGGWRRIGALRVSGDGSFAVRWRPPRADRVTLRAVAEGAAATGPRSARAATRDTAHERITVTRPAVASWYGPGLYGRRTACGFRLSPSTVGVAHRALPCGTRVMLAHRGRVVVASVIDRGPFIAGRELDLTAATAAQLGVRATTRVGMLALPRP